MSRNSVPSRVGRIVRVLVLGTALTVTAGTAFGAQTGGGGDGGTPVPELGSAAALTALTLVGCASLIWTNRRK